MIHHDDAHLKCTYRPASNKPSWHGAAAASQRRSRRNGKGSKHLSKHGCPLSSIAAKALALESLECFILVGWSWGPLLRIWRCGATSVGSPCFFLLRSFYCQNHVGRVSEGPRYLWSAASWSRNIEECWIAFNASDSNPVHHQLVLSA